MVEAAKVLIPGEFYGRMTRFVPAWQARRMKEAALEAQTLGAMNVSFTVNGRPGDIVTVKGLYGIDTKEMLQKGIYAVTVKSQYDDQYRVYSSELTDRVLKDVKQPIRRRLRNAWRFFTVSL